MVDFKKRMETQKMSRYRLRPGFTDGSTSHAPSQLVKRHAPELFSFKAEGEILEGTLLRIESVTIKDKKTQQPKRVAQYTFLSEGGRLLKMLGTYDLDSKIFQSDVGSYMEITYMGENKKVKSGDNFMKVF